MTTEDLIRAATTPSRWLTSVRRRYRQQAKKHASDEMPLKPPVVNPSPIGLKLSPNDEVQGVFLVPGGRFAFILTLHSLQLWDLGLVKGAADGSVDADLATGELLASVRMNQQYNITFSIQPTKDGVGLRVVVPSYPMDTAA